ncbi:MAG: N-formylglutamate amidohydrolase [Flavobacteriales bacterium]|jgi:predicted N-formylglutamate amidohydrolase|nr:N-formylglutamate amidohydrolase [Flavobacteriales bacterium]MCI1753491.1 N-formylglutamate amidohydrolase [Flavobacteriales bacterium]
MKKLFLSCEHAGNKVPANLRPLFKGADEVLATHRGWDIGALRLFKALVPLADHSAFETMSRLCIEMNRSIDNPELFSTYSKVANNEQKAFMLNLYHAYRSHFTTAVKDSIGAGHSVFHISVHSFTPVLNGDVRHVDIGLLYDPACALEHSFCSKWKQELEREFLDLKVRMNEPYKGTDDGFTTALRQEFHGRHSRHASAGHGNYAGIEIEVNQHFAPLGVMDKKIIEGIKVALENALARA